MDTVKKLSSLGVKEKANLSAGHTWTFFPIQSQTVNTSQKRKNE
jgi:hypothetical protein